MSPNSELNWIGAEPLVLSVIFLVGLGVLGVVILLKKVSQWLS